MSRPTPLAPFDPVDQGDVDQVANHPAFDDLSDVLVTDAAGQAGGSSDGHPWRQLRRKSSARRLRWSAVAVGAAAVIVAVPVTVDLATSPSAHPPVTTAPSPRPPVTTLPVSHPPFSTAWTAARPMPVPGGSSREHHGTWRLLDDVLSGQWTQNVDGPPPGTATCPSDHACYKLAGIYASSRPNAALRSMSLYVSADGGASWSVLPVPSGFIPTSSLSCGSVSWCAAGGTYDHDAVLLSTADGGHVFSVDPLPTGLGTLQELSCPAAGECDGLVSTQSNSTGSLPSTVTIDATFLSTNDGGKTFTDRPIIAGESMSAIDCSSPIDCIVTGVQNGPLRSSSTHPVVATTSDGGGTWQPGVFPAGFHGTISAPSCANAADCAVIGQIPVSNRLDKCTPTPVSQVMSPAVAAISTVESTLLIRAMEAAGSGGTCSPSQVADIATTTDGGQTWTPDHLPTSVPDPSIFGLSCPTADECWAAGTELVPVRIGNTSDEDSPVLLGTTDGGATWSKVTFSLPATAPNPTGQSYQSIGAMTCPTATMCLATGAAAAGASVSPVYSWVATAK